MGGGGGREEMFKKGRAHQAPQERISVCERMSTAGISPRKAW